MKRKNITLLMLATAKGKSFTPVQIQKAMFLISEEIPALFDEEHYCFEPYDYGPFDKAVYEDIRILEEEGLAIRCSNGRWNIYQSSEKVLKCAEDLLKSVHKEMADYINSVSEFVRSLNFAQLVSAIYEAYPEMKENSIFLGLQE